MNALVLLFIATVWSRKMLNTEKIKISFIHPLILI